MLGLQCCRAPGWFATFNMREPLSCKRSRVQEGFSSCCELPSSRISVYIGMKHTSVRIRVLGRRLTFQKYKSVSGRGLANAIPVVFAVFLLSLSMKLTSLY